MSDAIKAMIELIRQDKRTTWVAALCLALYGAGQSLSSYGFEPWGTIVSGFGGCVAGAALLFAKFSKKPPEEPPSVQG